MRSILGNNSMKKVEYYSITECGIPSLVLQERAALSVTKEVLNVITPKDKVLVFCGSGNNGADGLAAARMLCQAGVQADIYYLGKPEKQTAEFKVQADILAHMNIDINTYDETLISGEYAVVIDALFGIGLSRDLSEEYIQAISFIDSLNSYKIAVDIPSGVNGENGHIMGNAMHCDLTCAFAYEKLGTALYPGADYAGKVIVCDVGHIKCEIDGKRAYAYEMCDLKRLPPRVNRSHKGTYGKVLIIAGSEGMAGACYLSAASAYRTGAGLVYVMTPFANVSVIQTLLPEAVVIPYDPETISKESFINQLKNKDSVVFGPGMGRKEHVKMMAETVLDYSLETGVPTVIDADGLNSLAEERPLLEKLTKNVIITPHVGEMSRLCLKSSEEIMENLADTAIDFAEKYHCVCVLKDARTIVSNGTEEFCINLSGCNGMSTGGAGDTLTGIIAALASAGMTAHDAACLGCYVHGLSGEAAAEKKGVRSMLAGDIIAGLSDVLKKQEIL